MIKINSKYILDTDDLVFDVGAHNGDKTESYLKCGANVVCFEPQNECVANLKRRFLDNNHVHIEHKGLSDQEGKLQLSICTSDPYISTFSERWKTGRFISYNWD
jgi:FkbM family methyltransferase